MVAAQPLGIEPLASDGQRSTATEVRKEVLLAGATLVSALPQLLIAELDAPPKTIARMLRALAEAGVVISAGQQRDITGVGRDDLTVEDVEASVAAKSGAVHGLAAKLAAQLAGADDETTACYEQMGMRERGRKGSGCRSRR